MNRIKRIFVWLCRLPYSCGFGIQSPTDYAFVREVVNEHGAYYAYQQFAAFKEDSLHQKLGKLYFRLANWRQPSEMLQDEYKPYWEAGCRSVQWKSSLDNMELVRIKLKADDKEWIPYIYNKVNHRTVLVIEDIYRDWDFWHKVEKDPRTGVTFDLYYCGIVLFDLTRHKKNYKVNF